MAKKIYRIFVPFPAQDSKIEEIKNPVPTLIELSETKDLDLNSTTPAIPFFFWESIDEYVKAKAYEPTLGAFLPIPPNQAPDNATTYYAFLGEINLKIIERTVQPNIISTH